MNTGLTLRTVRVKDGVAEVRAGATLLFGSDPEGEEEETRLKASALIDAIRRGDSARGPRAEAGADRPGDGRRVMMVDHEDSFVHTLAGYFRRTGAEVITYRAGFPRRLIAEERPDLVLLSPGPGRPEDFGVGETIGAARSRPASRCSVSASGCKASWSTTAGVSRCCRPRCTARRRW